MTSGCVIGPRLAAAADLTLLLRLQMMDRQNQSMPFCFERLDDRVVLAASGMGCQTVDYPKSEFVNEFPDGSLQFASLRVGVFSDGSRTQLLEGDTVVVVLEHELRIAAIKEYLHGFADYLGTNVLQETLDLRHSVWGFGSGSTTKRFEQYISEQLHAEEPCVIRFSGDVRFELPGEGGEEFTGGFLELSEDGVGTLLRGGDIAELVNGYEMTSLGGVTRLTVDAQFGEMEFLLNDDHTLTDKFDRIWSPELDSHVMDPNAVDAVLGDIDESGSVDFADFLILAKNFGTAESLGDLDCDGKVAFADFLILSANFGS